MLPSVLERAGKGSDESKPFGEITMEDVPCDHTVMDKAVDGHSVGVNTRVVESSVPDNFFS